jgi:hypothetical protein
VAAVRKAALVARRLSTAAALSAVALAAALWNDGWWIALAVLAAIPAVVLWLFATALTEVAEIPERVRGAPAEAAGLAAALDEVRRARGSRLPGALWRAGRRAAGARELATPWAPLLALASVPFLVSAAVSALAVPLIVAAALIALAVAM